ncbi:hypothetical protein EJP617_09870 [Erwinia sp. Ejp617]|nr:hypothetical protein [Erwinia sp. Ejp617]ADP10668.1 hypothetical protein EJP617_09870 [Erwinia sp. Ejp617]
MAFLTTNEKPTMRTSDIPFATTGWPELAVAEHPGETGMAFWRTLQWGDVRMRRVDDSSGYLADP